jgi:hypothetical protein
LPRELPTAVGESSLLPAPIYIVGTVFGESYAGKLHLLIALLEENIEYSGRPSDELIDQLEAPRFALQLGEVPM